MDIINLFTVLDTFCETTKDIWILIGKVVRILQIAIPVIIILLGTIDLAKAVMSSKDDEIKKAQGMFIKRLIYGVAVFFVVMIVQAVFGLIGNSDGAASSVCFKCVSSPNKC